MHEKEPSSRLFFALWPEPPMRRALEAASRAVVEAGDGRAVPVVSFHLTLAFLGAVAQSRIPALSAVATQFAASFHRHGEPIAVTLDCIEHWRKPQILCATSSAEAIAAGALAEGLARALVAEGFAPDLANEFRPHVTLARKARHPIRAVGIRPVLWSLAEFALVQSRTQSQGAEYTVLASYPLM